MTDVRRASGGFGGGSLPAEIDATKPSIARVYDYMLGGKENFEVDRNVCKSMFKAVPETNQLAMDNRSLLGRGVRYLVGEAGLTQLVDLGSGLPTEGNVHEIAHAINPEVRVVYVDIDPIVLTHGRALLDNDDTTTVIQADVRDAASIFENPELTALVDLTKPFGVIASGIVHHFPDDVASDVVAGLKARLIPGSYIFISNFLDDDEARAKELEHAFLRGGLGTGRFRGWQEQQRYFDGLEMVEPGLVYANDWHPDDDTPTDSPVHTMYAGGIGRLPG